MFLLHTRFRALSYLVGRANHPPKGLVIARSSPLQPWPHSLWPETQDPKRAPGRRDQRTPFANFVGSCPRQGFRAWSSPMLLRRKDIPNSPKTFRQLDKAENAWFPVLARGKKLVVKPHAANLGCWQKPDSPTLPPLQPLQPANTAKCIMLTWNSSGFPLAANNPVSQMGGLHSSKAQHSACNCSWLSILLCTQFMGKKGKA